MTVKELKENYIKHNPEGMFFDEDMMKRYGESIDRMRVTGKGVVHTRNCGNIIAWELVAGQKTITGHREARYYFDEDTFEMFMVS